LTVILSCNSLPKERNGAAGEYRIATALFCGHGTFVSSVASLQDEHRFESRWVRRDSFIGQNKKTSQGKGWVRLILLHDLAVGGCDMEGYPWDISGSLWRLCTTAQPKPFLVCNNIERKIAGMKSLLKVHSICFCPSSYVRVVDAIAKVGGSLRIPSRALHALLIVLKHMHFGAA
jgi:hypothetical protein